MKTLHAANEIDAPAERVWGILTDLAAYPAWNPFIRRIAGDLAPRARLEVRLEPPGGITLRPTVLVVLTATEHGGGGAGRPRARRVRKTTLRPGPHAPAGAARSRLSSRNQTKGRR